ncbi:MAG: hypothetical protein ABI780_07085, partial [Ardenticatenales bacterium]
MPTAAAASVVRFTGGSSWVWGLGVSRRGSAPGWRTTPPCLPLSVVRRAGGAKVGLCEVVPQPWNDQRVQGRLVDRSLSTAVPSAARARLPLQPRESSTMTTSAPTSTTLTLSTRAALGVALLVAIARPFNARSAAEPEVVAQHGGRALALGGNASRLFVGWGQRVATVRRADIDDARDGSPPLERVSPLLKMRVGMMAVDGDYVLVGDSGSGIALLSAAADGSLALRAHMAAIDEPNRDLSFGRFAFKYPFAFLPGTSALKVLDVSGDRNVIEVARFQKPNEVFASVLVSDDGIVLAGTGDGGGRTPGVYAIDMSSPEQPREVSFLKLPGAVKGLARDGSVAYAYVVDASPGLANSSVASVYILDVSRFDHPSV